MEEINHAEMVAKLTKTGERILESLNFDKCNLLHHAIGISGEAGELLDCIKKHIVYNQALNRENAIEELGDLEFYMEGFRQAIGVTREECLQANIEKLSVRYKKLVYTDKQAKERNDKGGEMIYDK